MGQKKSSKRVSEVDAVINAIGDPVISGESWRPWRLCFKALFGQTEGLDGADAEFVLARTGRLKLPTRAASVAIFIVGRRGGKTRAKAFKMVYLSCFRDYSKVLAPGERGVGMIICPDRRQARVAFNYVTAIIDNSPMLRKMVERRTKDSIDLNNGVTLEVHTANYRSVRGYTVLFAIIDEAAFLPTDDSTEPDVELVRALQPAMATTGGLLVLSSTPYGKRGELWRQYSEHFGRDDDPVFVWQADTRTMNPTVAQDVIDRANADDPASASAEYGAEFRADLESLFSRDAVNAVVAKGRRELPPMAGHAYTGFVDPSGGSSDSYSLAIAHRQADGVFVLDLVREVRPPFSPDDVTMEFARLLKRYGISKVMGDRYGGEWPIERFHAYGIKYEPCELTRSELYLELLSPLNSGRVELLDHDRLIAQFVGLDRRTGRTGKDSVDHRPGSHDDVANAAAGAMVMTVQATGLKAPWPADFNQCLIWTPTHQPDCMLWGGSFRPIDPHCYRYCSGLKAARAAHREYLNRGGDQDIAEFVKTHFAMNEFVGRKVERRVLQALYIY
jgi:hypothetical protein